MNVKFEKFEGPLPLLLHLIEKEELDITQISLARIADQFVTYIRGDNNILPEEMADFLVVAAKLLLIKSKALLPYLYPEEEEDIKELEAQLKMYKEFLDAAKVVEKLIGKKKFMFAREFNRKALLRQANVFSPPKNFGQAEMKMIITDVIGRYRPPEKIAEKTLRKKITIEEKILNIQSLLLDRIKISFNNLIKKAENKTEVIVSFLAILELMRQKEIVLDQDELFSEIIISKKEKIGG